MYDISLVVNLVVDIVSYCLPFTLVFGFTGKILNFAFSMMFDKKIDI